MRDLRWRSCGCCSSRAPRCRSARTAIRRGSNGASRRRACAMRAQRKPGSATLLARSAGHGRGARAVAALRDGRRVAIGTTSDAGTPGSARRARRSELLAETLQMGGSLARLLADLDVLDAPRSRGADAHCACRIACRVCAGRARDGGSGAGRVDRISVVVARESGACGDEDDSAGTGGRASRCCSRWARDPGGGRAVRSDRRRRRRELRAGPGDRLGACTNAVLAALPFVNPTLALHDMTTAALRVGIGGPVGSGKTALALALCRHCASATRSRS